MKQRGHRKARCSEGCGGLNHVLGLNTERRGDKIRVSAMLLCRIQRGRFVTWLFSCDECGETFCGGRYHLKKRYQLCGRVCSNRSQKSGLLAQQVIDTNRARYGCDYTLQSDGVQAKRRATNVERYGVSEVVGLNLQRFLSDSGVVNSSQLPGHREKVKATSQERYGVDHPWQAAVVKDKIEATNVERYGVRSYSETPEFLDRVKATHVENLGVEWPMQSEAVKAKVDRRASSAKRHETMKRDGTYAKETKSEHACYVGLCEAFGADDVERHLVVNGWDVDFYVKSLATYLQADGVYWHGLDRPIEKIRLFEKPRDASIYGTFLRDIKQNAWFMNNGLKLCRVTDKQILLWSKQGTLAEELVNTLTERQERGQDGN